MFSYDKGIKIRAIPLWLDAVRRVKACCVSHAHMDHAKRHELVIATNQTIRLFQKRVGRTRFHNVSFRTPFDFEGHQVTFFPAGHILGSAQILVERNGTRLLYSGDFNTRKSATAEEIVIPESDILIMESTFGRPRYRFPARDIVVGKLLDFVNDSLIMGKTPVVLAYALGKSQEAMKILGDAGFRMAVHGSIASLAKVYEEFGIDFGRWEKIRKKDLDGKVLIFPRATIDNRFLGRLENKRTVFLSGWAMDPRTKFRNKVDEALPLSDHADFEGLLEYVKKVNPRRIYTTHGFTEYAGYLRALGYDASELNPSAQLSLF